MPGIKAFEKQLLRAGLVDDARLERAREEAEKNDLSLVDAIAQLGYAAEEAVYRCLAEFCELPFVMASRKEIPEELTEKLTARMATHYQVAPLEERNGAMVIALCDPLNTHLLDDVRQVYVDAASIDASLPFPHTWPLESCRIRQASCTHSAPRLRRRAAEDIVPLQRGLRDYSKR